jgi:hypothetical protein
MGALSAHRPEQCGQGSEREEKRSGQEPEHLRFVHLESSPETPGWAP